MPGPYHKRMGCTLPPVSPSSGRSASCPFLHLFVRLISSGEWRSPFGDSGRAVDYGCQQPASGSLRLQSILPTIDRRASVAGTSSTGSLRQLACSYNKSYNRLWSLNGIPARRLRMPPSTVYRSSSRRGCFLIRIALTRRMNAGITARSGGSPSAGSTGDSLRSPTLREAR